jgi:hypothetical protein
MLLLNYYKDGILVLSEGGSTMQVSTNHEQGIVMPRVMLIIIIMVVLRITLRAHAGKF